MILNYNGQKVEVDLNLENGEKEFDIDSNDLDLDDTIEIPTEEIKGEDNEIQ